MVECELVSPAIFGGRCCATVTICTNMRGIVGCLLRLLSLNGYLVYLSLYEFAVSVPEK